MQGIVMYCNVGYHWFSSPFIAIKLKLNGKNVSQNSRWHLKNHFLSINSLKDIKMPQWQKIKEKYPNNSWLTVIFIQLFNFFHFKCERKSCSLVYLSPRGSAHADDDKGRWLLAKRSRVVPQTARPGDPAYRTISR